jgi:hypothetical protein
MKLNIPNLCKCLEDVFEEEVKQKSLEKREFHHNPSSASFKVGEETVGACLRQLYYKATELPVTNPKQLTSYLTAEFGNAIHEKIFSLLKKHPALKVESEVPGKLKVDDLTHEISYRIDGLITHKGEKGGAELKTKTGFKLQHMVKEQGPDWADFAQIVTYFETDKELMWYVLLYVARDSGYRAEYHIYRDYNDGQKLKYISVVPENRNIKDIPVTFDQLAARWKTLESHLDKKIVPPRDYKVVLKEDGTPTALRQKNKVDYKSDMRCMYCPWLAHCWSQPDAKEQSLNNSWEKK